MARPKINPSKGSSVTSKSQVDNIQERHNAILDICSHLSGETALFNASDTYQKVEQYIRTHKRWYYSDISNFLFASDDEKVGSFMSNLESLQTYAYEMQSSKEAKQQVIMIDKLWDHANLAQRQIAAFSKKDADIDIHLDEKINSKMGALERELSKELISLISLFTALSFVIFGGISSLDNIFEGARSFPIMQVLVIGCVWGLCILNLVFVFVFFVSKLTRLPIASTDRVNANLVQKYPFWIYSNFFILFLLAVFGWLYMVDYANSGTWLIYCMQSNPMFSLIGGLLAIFVVFAIIFCILLWQLKKDLDQ